MKTIYKQNYERWVFRILPLFYAVGILGHFIDFTRPSILAMTPGVLLLTGLIVFLPIFYNKNRGVIIWAAGTYVVTFLIEAIGVATGKIFGPYTYGSTLGIQLLEVPPVIGFNWMIIVLAGVIFWGRYVTSPLLRALLTGLTAVVFDILMEPVAIKLDYWNWHSSTIPLKNYAAWFVIAFAASLIYGYSKLSTETKLPILLITIQFVFFFALSFLRV